VSTARMLFAGTLLYVSGVGLAQSPPATPSTGRILHDPPAAVAGESRSGVTPVTDTSAKKTFNESRSNSTRTAGDAKLTTPGANPSAKKTFNESRSNALRTPGDAKATPPDISTPANAQPVPPVPK